MRKRKENTLYCIAGKGRYTGKQVRRLLGKPNMNLTQAAERGRYGIKVVARRMHRFIRDGEVIATAQTFDELGEKVFYSGATMQARCTSKRNYLNHPYIVEDYWEDVCQE